MPTFTESWNPVTDGILTFSNIGVTEVDVGTTLSFVDTAGQPVAIDGPQNGIQWGGFGALTFGAGSSQTLTFDYDVASASPDDLIASINGLYIVDLVVGAGAHLVATANVFNLNGELIGTQSFTQGGPFPDAVTFVQAQQAVHVTLTISEFIDPGDTTGSAIDLSGIQQTFTTTSVDQLASIGDYVWLDLDGNGLQTAPGADPGIGSVTVQLMDASGTDVLLTTTTDNTGFYLFDHLTAGTYTIRFVTPDGFVFSPQDIGGDEAIDSDVDATTGLTGPITLEAGDHIRDVDAGLVPDGSGAGSTATLGDFVWIDANQNGVQDADEAGLEGVTVNLLDATGTTILDSMQTDMSGQYAFTNLAAGTYVVQFVGPDGYVFSQADQGDDGADSDADRTTGLTAPVTLAGGEVNATVDAGLILATAEIGDRVWIDANGNGVQDDGELGIGGVGVNLLNGLGETIGSTSTDSDGSYLFAGLTAGTYQVEFESVENFTFTNANAPGSDLADSDADAGTGRTGAIVLTAGESNHSVDAGLVAIPPALGSIGNYVWHDCDNDGLQDSNEHGLGGVTVQLRAANGVDVLASTTTNASGFYQFSDLVAGTYQVYFGTKSGYQLVAANRGTDDTKDSDADTATRLSGPIVLAAGEHNTTVDAGMISYMAPTGSIGNYVWFDYDKDGKQDYGEQGLDWVEVKLMNATATQVLATTMTNASGYYQFSNLAAGTYQVYFGTKSGFQLTAANQGMDDSKDSDANTATRLSGPITLAAGQNITTVDAGMIKYVPPTGSIGNYVWNDTDMDGVQDYGEQGLDWITVKLLDASGTTVLATTSTDSTGFYKFSNLAAGTYQIYFGTKTGYQLTAANQGMDDGKDSDANTSTRLSGPIVLAAGENNTSVDAGLHLIQSGGTSHGGDRMEGLSAGFWSTHLKAWDGASDTKYANLVQSGTLDSVDVLRALPNLGKSGPGNAVGVLLGDSNGNGIADNGETTLFVGLTAAQQIISSSASATDARQILMRQALAAQLNIYNGKDAAGGLTVGADLISKAVQWLRGQGPFIYSDGSSGNVDRVGASGVLDSGSYGWVDFKTSTGAFTSSALSSSKAAWYQDKWLGVGDFTADGEEIKNALQAFNEDRLITSADGTRVGWNSGGSMIDAQTNDAAGLWTVLREHGVI